MKRILIVEDRPHTRALLRMTLGHDGYELHEAATADEGMSAMSSIRPDVVLVGNLGDRAHAERLGVDHPDSVSTSANGGLHFCRRIRNDENTRSTAILVMVPHEREGCSARDAGADRYLEQPVRPLRLIEAVDSLAAAHAA